MSSVEQIGKSTLYYALHVPGNNVTTFDSGDVWVDHVLAEKSLALTGLTSGATYDVVAYFLSSTLKIDLVPAWAGQGMAVGGLTNATPIVVSAVAHGLNNGDEVYITGVQGTTAANGTWIVANKAANTFELTGSVGNAAYIASTGYFTARAAANLFVRQDGAWVNASALTSVINADAIGAKRGLLLGTIRTTGTTTTEDSLVKRFVGNLYNKVARQLWRAETAATWTYGTATWRQANANTANQLAWVSPDITTVEVFLSVTGSNQTGRGEASLGLSNVLVPALETQISAVAFTTLDVPQDSLLSPVAAPGYNFAAWLERVESGTSTWNGVSTTILRSGLGGWVWA